MFAGFFSKHLMLAVFQPHSVLSLPPLFHADKIFCLIPFLKMLFTFFNLDIKTCVGLVKLFFIKTNPGTLFFLACFLSFPKHLLNREFGSISYASPFALYFYLLCFNKQTSFWSWGISALGKQDFCSCFDKWKPRPETSPSYYLIGTMMIICVTCYKIWGNVNGLRSCVCK